jgi:hypothetical protein
VTFIGSDCPLLPPDEWARGVQEAARGEAYVCPGEREERRERERGREGEERREVEREREREREGEERRVCDCVFF